MQVRVRIEFEEMRRVESVQLVLKTDSANVRGLKRMIMNMGGIDIPMGVVGLYKGDALGTDEGLVDDDIVSGGAETVFLWMRVPRPHVVYEMKLPGGQALRGDIYMNKETITVADVENELLKRYGVFLSSSNLPILISLETARTQVLSLNYEFRKEAIRVYSRPSSPQSVLDNRQLPTLGDRLDGLNSTEYCLPRRELIERIWSTVNKNRFLVICSPPATGKTSLLQLIRRQFPSECRYVSFFQDIKTKSASDLLSPLVRGIDGRQVTILIDDAQERYTETDFLAELVKIPDELKPQAAAVSSNVRYIICATYKLNCSVNCPIVLSDLNCLTRKDLLITDDECRLVLSWVLPTRWHNFPRFLDTMVFESSGHIGAAVAAAVCLKAHFRDTADDEVSEKQLYECYFADKLLQGLYRCFGKFAMKPESDRLRSILANALLRGCTLDLYPPDYNNEDRVLLSKMRKFGILEDGDESVVEYCSPLSRRFVLNWLYPNRPSIVPSNMRELLKTALQKLSRSSLLSSTHGSFPLEATFQAHLLNAIIASTPIGCRTVPEMSILFRDGDGKQGKRVQGRVDFYINNRLRWGVELLVNGSRVGEHVHRFSPGGRYASLEVADYMVIDLRQGPVVSNVVYKSEKKSRVFFEPSFQYCDVVHEFEEDAKRIYLQV